MRRPDLSSHTLEYVLPGLLAIVLIVTGGVLLIFVDGVVRAGWAAISLGMLILLFLRVAWQNDGP
ncbi:MAG: hypothetical protein JWM61_223 [Micrococcaceae bacterium]|jgi:hypothetical protein|nr:hypothetical protein [Micrococcaceae bacterium]